MKKLLTMALCLPIALSLLAGCNAGGFQSISPPSANQNVPVGHGSTASGLHQAVGSAGLLTHPRGYTVTDIGTLGGTFSSPGSISNGGAIAGDSTLVGDTIQHGFLWAKGRLIDVGSLPEGPNSAAIVGNSRLQVVGAADSASTLHDGNALWCTVDVSSSRSCHAILWQNGIMTDLGTMGGSSSIGEWINNRGDIVGMSQINAIDPNGDQWNGGGPGQINRAYLLKNGRFEDLGTLGGLDASATTISDRGQIVGTSQVATKIDPTIGFVPSHAALWTNGAVTDLGSLGGGLSVAFAVNDEGAVAGVSTLAGEQHFHAFRWQNGVISDLGALPGDSDSLAFGMNNFGQVVGFSSTSSTIRAFIQRDGVMTDLNTLISPTSGYQLEIAYWINDAGQIAAQAAVESTGEAHSVILTPSNNSIRGKAGVAPLTPSLRRYLLRRIGYGLLKSLRSNH